VLLIFLVKYSGRLISWYFQQIVFKFEQTVIKLLLLEVSVTRILYFLVVFIAVFTLFLPSNGLGEERKLTLTEAIKIALEENYELRAAKNALSAQKEGVGIARSAFLPKLTFEERAARTNNPPLSFMMKLNQQRFSQNDFVVDTLNNPQPINDYQTAFFLEQPVFSMKSFMGLSIAKNEYAAKSVDYQRTKEETVFKVVQAYMRVHTAREYLAVAHQGIEDTREHLRITEARYKNDLGLYSDSLRARTALAEAEQILVSAEKEYSVAKKWFGVLLASSEPIDTIDENLTCAPKDFSYYKEVSLTRKDLAAIKTRYETARKNIKAAESAYFPYVGVGGSYQMNDHHKLFGAEGDSWQVSAFLRWELFDGMNREYQKSKAQYQAAEVKEYANSLREFISFKVHEACLSVEEAKKNLELAHAALKSAEEGKRLVMSRYENSLSPIVDLLDVQLNLSHARATAVARENAYKLAVINLGYESGTIMQDLNIE
jgi:outer membrane protein